jgi:hypothetical protein
MPKKPNPYAKLSLPDLLAGLRDQHRRGVDFMSARCRLELQMKSICRRFCDGDKDAGSKAYLKAKKGSDAKLAVYLAPFFAAHAQLEEQEAECSKAMAKMAECLPVAAWVDGVHGLGALSIARIVAELGDPGAYSNPAKCWKRLGLAVFGGMRQGQVAKEITGDARAAEFQRHGYSPRRRSIVYVAIESMLRQSKCPYRQLYLERKEYETPRVETKMHAHRRAQRYVAKRVVLDLWKQWRVAIGIKEAA